MAVIIAVEVAIEKNWRQGVKKKTHEEWLAHLMMRNNLSLLEAVQISTLLGLKLKIEIIPKEGI